ncbi:regulator of G-protein signaling [Acrasis kona]|uniref:Regulator of G-protein signaling n=1 Tax=Acrasis kona TaxID=1008807 RepID=A0AAW2YYN6_9EUKA
MNRDMTVSVIQDIDFDFELVFDDKGMRSCFHKYLIKMHNVEPYLFLVDLERYASYIGPTNRYKCARKIVKTYLRPTTNRGINVPQETKDSILNTFKSCSEIKCPKSLFDDIMTLIYVEFREDCFPIFITSKLFINHAVERSKKDPNFLYTIGRPKPCIVVCGADADPNVAQRIMNYDMSKMEISDLDFEEALRGIKNESLWELNTRSETRAVYTSKQLFYCKKRAYKKVLETMTLPYTVDQVFNAMHDPRYIDTIDKQIKYKCVSEQLRNGKYYPLLCSAVLKLSFPFKTRDFSLLCCARRQRDGNIVMIKKSVTSPLLPETSSNVRAVAFLGFLLEAVDGGHTRFSNSLFSDIGGYITPALHTRAVAQRNAGTDFYDALCAACEARLNANEIHPTRNPEYPITDSLTHFEEYRMLDNDNNFSSSIRRMPSVAIKP